MFSFLLLSISCSYQHILLFWNLKKNSHVRVTNIFAFIISHKVQLLTKSMKLIQQPLLRHEVGRCTEFDIHYSYCYLTNTEEHARSIKSHHSQFSGWNGLKNHSLTLRWLLSQLLLSFFFSYWYTFTPPPDLTHGRVSAPKGARSYTRIQWMLFLDLWPSIECKGIT